MTKTKTTPRTLSGFAELMPDEQLLFNEIVSSLESIYRSFGFMPLDTPVLESSEVLLAKAGGETEKQIYRFNKGDSDLTMRFDLTVPLAKYVAMHFNQLSFPFRRFQIGKVYRGERAQRGRFREFYQADIDIVGDTELAIMNDAEIPSIIYEAFTKLGLTDYTIRINNRKVLYGLFLMYSLQNSAEEVMRILDKAEKIGADKVRSELSAIGVSGDTADRLLQFISISGTSTEILDQLRMIPNKNDIFEAGINELANVTTAVSMFGVPPESYKIDLSIARGLDYYTGTVYETTFRRHPEIGSICSGGRYDNLASFYTDKKLPGVGVSIGLTRLFYILSEKKYLYRENRPAFDVLVVPMTENYQYAISFASYLRESNVKSQVYYENRKIKNKIGYADKLSVPFVAFMGENEVTQNAVTLKNLKTSEQITVGWGQSIEVIKGFLSETLHAKIIQLPNE